MGAYDAVLGTLLIGVISNNYLYGVVSYQYAHYCSKKFNDPLRIKLPVFALFLVDTAHSVLMVYLCWIYFVEHYAQPELLSVPQWPGAFIPIGTALTASITHIFLGIRLLGLSKHPFMFAIVLIMTLAEFAAGISFGIRMWTMKSMTELYAVKPYVIPWLLIQTTLDVFVSAFMTVFLHRHRSGCGHTDSVINRLIRGAIQTGGFSAILAIGGLVAFLVRPYTILYAMFMIPIGRTYTTTLMDTLNVRTELKEKLLTGGDHEMPELAWSRSNAQASEDGARRSVALPNESSTFPDFVKNRSLDDITTKPTTATNEFVIKSINVNVTSRRTSTTPSSHVI